MRIFKNAWFERFARKQKIRDGMLREAVVRAEQGLIDADLGGGVIKQRLARPGQGRSGGYRTLILYRQAHRAFFVYGFAKSQQANISDEEETAFKNAARHVLELTDEQLSALIQNGQFSEIDSSLKKSAF
ncbi:addiction module toxin RelE [Rhabdochromatium marinum]|nr:addiction module toxin RelE [Rhabdochromatium marinum]